MTNETVREFIERNIEARDTFDSIVWGLWFKVEDGNLPDVSKDYIRACVLSVWWEMQRDGRIDTQPESEWVGLTYAQTPV